MSCPETGGGLACDRVGGLCWVRVLAHGAQHVSFSAFPPSLGWSQSPLPSVGRDESCQPLLPKRSVGAWLGPRDCGAVGARCWAGLAWPRPGMLSLEPEAALSARAGVVCRCVGVSGRLCTGWSQQNVDSLHWQGWWGRACSSTSGQLWVRWGWLLEVALLGPPALVWVSHLPVRWPGSSSRRDRRLTLSRATASPQACTQRSPTASMGTLSCSRCARPPAKLTTSALGHAAVGTETW